MEILVGFGIGPRTESIIQYYWENLSMLERLGQYYITPFKVHWGVTQGDIRVIYFMDLW